MIPLKLARRRLRRSVKEPSALVGLLDFLNLLVPLYLFPNMGFHPICGPWTYPYPLILFLSQFFDECWPLNAENYTANAVFVVITRPTNS